MIAELPTRTEIVKVGDEESTIEVRKEWRDAWNYKRSGYSVDEIATELKVDPRTVYRWITRYLDSYRNSLEAKTKVHLVSEQLASLESIEKKALRDYESTIGVRDRHGSLTVALKARTAIGDLLLRTGIVPAAPEKIYAKILDEKRMSDREPREGTRTKEEIIENIIEVIKRTRTV